MKKGKKSLLIISTNWIHIVGFYLTTYISLIVFKLIGFEDSKTEGWNQILFHNILSIPILFMTYGILIILGFYISIIILDLVTINRTKEKIKVILIIEYLLIVPIFLNWALEYEYWLWIPLSISFLITQLMREKRIDGINKTYYNKG